MKHARICTAAVISIMAAGCTGDSTEGTALSCPLPDEVSCESVSSVYSRTAAVAPVQEFTDSQVASNERSALWPQVKPPRILKIWLAPWQDTEGDLHGAQDIYLLLEQQTWQSVRVEDSSEIQPGLDEQ